MHVFPLFAMTTYVNSDMALPSCISLLLVDSFNCQMLYGLITSFVSISKPLCASNGYHALVYHTL